jgi:hypothetical protein
MVLGTDIEREDFIVGTSLHCGRRLRMHPPSDTANDENAKRPDRRKGLVSWEETFTPVGRRRLKCPEGVGADSLGTAVADGKECLPHDRGDVRIVPDGRGKKARLFRQTRLPQAVDDHREGLRVPERQLLLERRHGNAGRQRLEFGDGCSSLLRPI